VNVPAPDGFEHGIVQFVASREGYNVCLPCPEGPSSHGLRVNRNGFAGSTFLVQQAVRNGRLVAICECVCGRRYNLPTILDAEPVCESLLAQAEQALRRKDETRAAYLVEVARRVRVGYSETIAA
jgi:3-methyladenine DNA glycosylase/8-oxoguanine DNA glycosylase